MAGMKTHCSNLLLPLGGTLLIAVMAGCSPDPEFKFNAVQMRAKERIELEADQTFDPIHERDIGNILTAMFGTPDEPHFPQIGEDFSDLVRQENLEIAAGPVQSDRLGKHGGLYREHCASCHGITGDGAGPSAAFLNPYPRDFRLGKFKFKRTKVFSPPTDHDLDRILRNGIPGTAMPSFKTLDDEEIAALVDYVKYLSIRGQVEKKLIDYVADLDAEAGERLIDINYPNTDQNESSDSEPPATEEAVFFQNAGKSKPTSPVSHNWSHANQDDDAEPGENSQNDDPPAMSEQREELLDILVNDILYEVLDAWLDREDGLVEIPNAPPEFKLDHADHSKLVKKGRELFFGKANCLLCHGNTGLGDGGQVNFDDWTSAWTKDTGVNLVELDTYDDFLALGALHPRQLRPRNLRQGVFRGGDKPTDIYHRVSEGIEGTPMPATLTLNEDEKWALVAYVMNMPYEESNAPGEVKK